MSFTSPLGIAFPNIALGIVDGGTGKTVDAATEKAALIGQIAFSDAASTKIISSAGGSVTLRLAATTFVNSASSVDIGLQRYDSATTSTVIRPDGVFLVNATIVGATDTVTSNSWNTFTMETGSVAIGDGDIVSLVMDMVNVGGADTLAWSAYNTIDGVNMRPTTNVFLAGSWSSAPLQDLPLGYVTFDDGSHGVFTAPKLLTFGILPAAESFSSTTNPDERGMLFNTPSNCQIGGLFVRAGGVSSASDFVVNLWSSPFSTTPTQMHSTTVLPENSSLAAAGQLTIHFPDKISLTGSTDYALTVRAISTGTVTLNPIQLGHEDLRAFLDGGTSLKRVTRNNGSGAFTSDAVNSTVYTMGVLVTDIETGGGGGLKLVGTGGLAG